MSEPKSLTLARLQGFIVRPPASSEIPTLQGFFPQNPLGRENLTFLGAFGQPGNVPLGAVAVRPAQRGGEHIGHFIVYVRSDARRRHVGATLMTHLYRLARDNRADRLVLADLVHQDQPENAFCRTIGLLPERMFGTYSLPIGHGFETVCEPATRRFERSHPHLSGAQIVPIEQVDPHQLAQFVTTNYTGFIDQKLDQLRGGYYDRNLSTAATRGGKILACSLVRSKPGEPSVFIDLMLSAPLFRNGPTPLVLLAHAAPVARSRHFTHCVFEADERHDRFAVGAALRCGASVLWLRYRYAIESADIAARASLNSPTLTATAPFVNEADAR